jgi:hypothetical protein
MIRLKLRVPIMQQARGMEGRKTIVTDGCS